MRICMIFVGDTRFQLNRLIFAKVKRDIISNEIHFNIFQKFQQQQPKTLYDWNRPFLKSARLHN